MNKAKIMYYVPRKGDRFIVDEPMSIDCYNFMVTVLPSDIKPLKIKLKRGDEFVLADEIVVGSRGLGPQPIVARFIFIQKATKVLTSMFVEPAFMNGSQIELVSHKNSTSVSTLRAEIDSNFKRKYDASKNNQKKSRLIKKAFQNRLKCAAAPDTRDILVRASLFEMLHIINAKFKSYGYSDRWTTKNITNNDEFAWSGRTKITDDGSFRAKFSMAYPAELAWHYEGKMTDDGVIVDDILFPNFENELKNKQKV